MKKICLLMLVCYCCQRTSAQSWNITGNSGLDTTKFLGTTDKRDLIFKTGNIEGGRLLKSSIWRLGSATNYVKIDTAGKLSFVGTGTFLFNSNKYLFQNTANPNYGFYFNSTGPQYEFRSSTATPSFYVNANSGNGVFAGTLKIGAYTLPATDGTNGQTLTTNGDGKVKWSTINTNSGANTSLSNLNTTTAINANLLPNASKSLNLGSVDQPWTNIYFGGKIYYGQDPVLIVDAVKTNITLGSLSLFKNVNGSYNVSIGQESLFSNKDGGSNIAIGLEALTLNTVGNTNTAIGVQALLSNKDGNSNTAVGYGALVGGVDGSQVTILGARADVLYDFDDATAIGANTIVDDSYKTRVGDENQTSIGGQVGWTSFSDGRYKKDIKENVQGLKFINLLKPITYSVDVNALDNYYHKNQKHDSLYNSEKMQMKTAAQEHSSIVYNGFIAQDVEKAAQSLQYNFSGVDKPKSKDGVYGLRYGDFVVPLVKAVQELSKANDAKDSVISNLKNTYDAKIDALQNQINELKTMIVSSQSQISNAQQASISSASLEQNVPNPFSNTTTIGYYLPGQFASAKIIITDRNGKALKQLNLSSSGKGIIQVEASTLSAGAYNYSLYINEKLIASKQMIRSK